MASDSLLYCGCCSFSFQTISELHIHLCSFTHSGSYVFDKATCTGYPRFDRDSQTFTAEGSLNTDEFSQTDNELHWPPDFDVNEDSFIKEEDECITVTEKKEPVSINNEVVLTDKNALENTAYAPMSLNSDGFKQEKSQSRLTCIKSCQILPQKCTNGQKSFVNPNLGPLNNTADLETEEEASSSQTDSSDFNVIKIEKEMETDSDYNMDQDTDDEYQPPKPKRVKNEPPKCIPKNNSCSQNCKFCDLSFKTQYRLIKHVQDEHPDEKPFECSECCEKFSSKQERVVHMRKMHKKRRDMQCFQCDICPKVLKSAKALRSHLDTHKGDKTVECHHCNAKFRYTSKLNEHIQRHHEISYDHMCSKCGKLFKTNSDLYHHRIVCSGIRKFQCNDCEKKFFTKCDLMKHSRTHTGETPYVCEECGNKYRHLFSLNTHKLVHTGERPFKCPHCPQTFSLRNAFRDHRRIHEKDQRFVCPYCKKSFIKKCNMEVHVLQHTGETPFKCDRCGQGYKQRVLLKRHLVQQHKHELSNEEITKYRLATFMKPAVDDNMTWFQQFE